MSESTNVCRECGTDLLFSARARGNGLCEPCTRAGCTHPSKTRGDEFHPDRCDICHAPVFPPALVPQPPPASPPRGEPVWPLVIDELEDSGISPRLIALMRARDQQGRAKYGVPLSVDDGRDTTIDAIQEALDLIIYLRKRRAEGRIGYRWWEMQTVKIVEGLLVELEREGREASPVASPGNGDEAGKETR